MKPQLKEQTEPRSRVQTYQAQRCLQMQRSCLPQPVRCGPAWQISQSGTGPKPAAGPGEAGGFLTEIGACKTGLLVISQ